MIILLNLGLSIIYRIYVESWECLLYISTRTLIALRYFRNIMIRNLKFARYQL